MRPLILLFALALSSCGPATTSLLVNLRTDFTPGVDFTAVEIWRDGERVTTVSVDRGRDFSRFARVAELVDPPAGLAEFRVVLVRAGGAAGRRAALIEVRPGLADLLAVSIARQCAGVMCPEGLTCGRGGQCIDPSCVRGDEPSCPPPACASDGECSAAVQCARATCEDGECFSFGDDARCPEGRRCDPSLGCVLELRDAGVADGGLLEVPDGCAPAGESCDGLDQDCDGRVDETFDFATNPAHCGECGRACSSRFGAPVCQLGVCTTTCDVGRLDCDTDRSDCEADASSEATCGGCNVRCVAPTPVCVSQGGGFACGSGCDPGQTQCGQSCVDVTTSEMHCGACGAQCGAAEACVGGRCECGPDRGGAGGGAVCGAGQTCCASGCADTDGDASSCGACGVSCGPGETCVGGRCRCAGATGPVGGGAACTGSESCCPALGCRSLANDEGSCGACGASCGVDEVCSAGRCACAGQVGAAGGGAVCTNPRTCCPSTGCRDLSSNGHHCGACEVWCGGGESCVGGRCTCLGQQGSVGGGPICVMSRCCADGCAPTSTDASNCGACGVTCGPGEETCDGGRCQCGGQQGAMGGGPVCTGNQRCCNDDCVNTSSSETHCGGCGQPCGAGETCASGACGCNGGAACSAGRTCCPIGCRNLDTNGHNCGACGVSCGPGEDCVGGRCDCNGTTGAVGGGRVCSPGQACCAGGCTDVDADRFNCGACGATCGTGEVCSGGRCICSDEEGEVGGGAVCQGIEQCCLVCGFCLPTSECSSAMCL